MLKGAVRALTPVKQVAGIIGIKTLNCPSESLYYLKTLTWNRMHYIFQNPILLLLFALQIQIIILASVLFAVLTENQVQVPVYHVPRDTIWSTIIPSPTSSS